MQIAGHSYVHSEGKKLKAEISCRMIGQMSTPISPHGWEAGAIAFFGLTSWGQGLWSPGTDRYVW